MLEALHKSQVEREKQMPLQPAILTISSVEELKDDPAWYNQQVEDRYRMQQIEWAK